MKLGNLEKCINLNSLQAGHFFLSATVLRVMGRSEAEANSSTTHPVGPTLGSSLQKSPPANPRGLAFQYAKDKLSEAATYKVALFVGTLITVYGHFLLPALKGRHDLLSTFVQELRASPLLGALSLLVALLLPLGVQVYAAVSTRLETDHG